MNSSLKKLYPSLSLEFFIAERWTILDWSLVSAVLTNVRFVASEGNHSARNHKSLHLRTFEKTEWKNGGIGNVWRHFISHVNIMLDFSSGSYCLMYPPHVIVTKTLLDSHFGKSVVVGGLGLKCDVITNLPAQSVVYLWTCPAQSSETCYRLRNRTTLALLPIHWPHPRLFDRSVGVWSVHGRQERSVSPSMNPWSRLFLS